MCSKALNCRHYQKQSRTTRLLPQVDSSSGYVLNLGPYLKLQGLIVALGTRPNSLYLLCNP